MLYFHLLVVGFLVQFCVSISTRLPEPFLNSSLFSSNVVESGKSVLQCKPNFSKHVVVEHKFYYVNGVVQVDGNSNDDGVVSILLTFMAEREVKWNRLTIVIGIPGSSLASFTYAQDIFAPSSLAMIQSRADKKFCFGKLFDVFVSLPKARLPVNEGLVQLPANNNSYFIELYFDYRRSSPSPKKKSRTMVDCVRVEDAYKIDFVPIATSLPSIIYSLEPIDISISNLVKYSGNNVTFISGELARLEFLPVTNSSSGGGGSGSCGGAPQHAPLQVDIDKDTISFSVPLCDPAKWRLYALLPDGIHYIQIEFFAQSRIDEAHRSGLLSKNISMFIEEAASLPLDRQLESMSTLINAVAPLSRASSGSTDVSQLLALPSMQQLLTSASVVDPEASALALANVILLTQSLRTLRSNISDVYSSAMQLATKQSSASTLAKYHNNHVSFSHLTDASELECNANVIAYKLVKLRRSTGLMLALARYYRIIVIGAEIPTINFIVAAGVVTAIAVYVHEILAFVQAEQRFRLCHADCGIAEGLPWENKVYLQAGQPKAISDLLVVSESFSLSPDGCFFQLHPTLFSGFAVMANDIITILDALPTDVRAFTGIDSIAKSLSELFVPGHRSEAYLTASNIISIHSVAFLPVVQCHSTAVSNVVLCDPGYDQNVISRNVPLEVTYVLDSESPIQRRTVFADVTPAPTVSPTPAPTTKPIPLSTAAPTFRTTLNTEVCVTEIVQHAVFGVSNRFTVRPSTIGTYCCSQTFPSDAGSFCVEGGTDIDVTPSQVGVYTTVGCVQIMRQFANNNINFAMFCTMSSSRSQIVGPEPYTYHYFCSCSI